MKRHKPPTLVSMWMLDVFCCALGCVTLLWLLKTREAGFALEETSQVQSHLSDTKLQLADESLRNLELSQTLEEKANQLVLVEKERNEQAKQLALVEKERDEQAKQLALTRQDLDKTGNRLALVEKEASATAKELALAKTKIEDDKKALALLESKSSSTEEELSKKKTEIATLNKQMDSSKKSADDLERLLREKEKLRETEGKRATELAEKIESLNKTKVETDKQSMDLTKALERVKKLERDLGESTASIVDLQGVKAKLADKVNKLEIDSQSKFAGIALTGKRVFFLGDMSGSMELTDEKTFEPTKWPTVRATLIKVMRSLPDLEKYQVMLFSNRNAYLFSETKEWIDYEKDKSLEQVEKAMALTKPAGDTNMYSAFEECFKYREKGMDTIYLFSDGLPNSGPGLTDLQNRSNLPDYERQTLLAKHIRKLLNTDWNREQVKQPKVRINSIGFFFESPDLGAFLWALAREHDGSFVGMSKP